MKLHRLIPGAGLFFLFSAAFVPAHAQRYYMGCSSCVPLHCSFQYWKTVSNDPNLYSRYLTGTIQSMHENNNGACADGDWCIFVKPDAAYSDLLVNHIGRENCGEHSGLIEVEMVNPLNLKSIFSQGDKVRVHGWWSEDYGHTPCGANTTIAMDETGGKTELHPVNYISSANGQIRKFVFMQDMSHRFESEVQESLGGHASFWVNYTPAEYQRPLVPVTTHNIKGKVIIEVADIDKEISRFSNNSFNLNVWSTMKSTVDYSIKSNSVAFDVSLQTADLVTMLGAGAPVLSPYVYLKFDEKEQDIVEETISWSIVVNPVSGQQTMIGNVDLKVLRQLANYSWDIRSVRNIRQLLMFPTAVTTTHFSTQSISFPFRYAPGTGYVNTAIEINLVGLEKVGGSWDLKRTNAAADQVFTRDIVLLQKRYFLTASTLSLEKTLSKTSNSPLEYTAVVKPTVELIDPAVTVGPITWTVAMTTNESGSAVSPINSQPVLGTITLGNNEISLDASNQLLIKFKDPNPATQQFENSAVFQVVATASTGLGEVVTKSLLVDSNPLIRFVDKDLFKNFFKLILYGEMIKDRINPTWLQTDGIPLPKTFTAQDKTRFANFVKSDKAAADEFDDKLDAPFKQLIDIYQRMEKNQNVTPSETARLKLALERAQQLPDIQGADKHLIILPEKNKRIGFAWEQIPKQ